MNERTILTPLGGIWCFQDGDFPDVVQGGTSKTSMGITLTTNLVETNCWFSLSRDSESVRQRVGPPDSAFLSSILEMLVLLVHGMHEVALLLRTLPRMLISVPRWEWAKPVVVRRLEKQWAQPGASGNHGQIQIAACFYCGCEWRMVLHFKMVKKT